MDAVVVWNYVLLLIHIDHQENMLIFICHYNGPKDRALNLTIGSGPYNVSDS